MQKVKNWKVQNLCNKGNKSNKSNKGWKAFAIMLLLCPLAMSCAKSGKNDAQLAESQNNMTEMQHRLAYLEDRVANIDNTVQESNSRVYEVRNKSGRSTGMTAHPKPVAVTPPATTTPASSTGQPVAHVSPMTDAKNTPAPVIPVNSSHVPTLNTAQSPAPVMPPATAPTASASAQGAKSPYHATGTPSPIAPMGVLDSSSGKGGVLITENNEAAASGTLSLPPESAMYPPNQVTPASTLVPVVNPNQVVAPVTPVAVQPVAVQSTTPKPVRAASGEQGAYKQALDMVLAGQFAQGREKFNAFLQQYPNGKLAANAYYWVGESYYAQKNYPEALLSFKQVTSSYPKHHKTPDALLKAGMTYEKLGDMPNASLQYQALLADFPNSNAAKIARNKKL